MLVVAAMEGGLLAVGFENPEGGGTGARDAAAWMTEDGHSWSRILHNVNVVGGDGWQQMQAVTPFGSAVAAVGIEDTSQRFDFDAVVCLAMADLGWSD